jgi:hypothetical protein
MSRQIIKKINQTNHYFYQSNPFKTIDSLSSLISDHVIQTDNKDLALLNKPPGFVLLGKII